jgi:hypothetical protein
MTRRLIAAAFLALTLAAGSASFLTSSATPAAASCEDSACD